MDTLLYIFIGISIGVILEALLIMGVITYVFREKS